MALVLHLQAQRALSQQQVDQRAAEHDRWSVPALERFEDQAHHYVGASAH